MQSQGDVRLPSHVDVYEIIQEVRYKTEIPYDAAREAMSIVVEKLLPFMSDSSSNVVQHVHEILQGSLNIEDDDILYGTTDMATLVDVEKKLRTMKNDRQQRSWSLYDDEETITHDLILLKSTLKNADLNVSRKFLSRNESSFITCLAEYYQMESRWSIRQLLLETFSVMHSIYHAVACLLLYSVLPLELSRDLMSNETRMLASVDMLSEIFSCQERMPITYLEYMGEPVVLYLLDIVMENDHPSKDISEKVSEFLMIYNLQFSLEEMENNVMISALLKHPNPLCFIATVLFYLNRGKNPLNRFRNVNCRSEDENSNYVPNCALKLVTELFSDSATVSLFYNNDQKVLVGIVLRNILDMEPSEKEWKDWLHLLRCILENCEEPIYNSYKENLKLWCSKMRSEDYTTVEEVNVVLDIIERKFT